MSKRPNFTEYIMTRLLTLSVFIFIIFSVIILILSKKDQDAMLGILLLALAFILFVFLIYRAAGKMQKELKIISKYLKNLNEIDKIDDARHFSTKEFDDINQNLIKVLKNAKKREDIKRRYNAKLKLKNRQRADMLSAIAHEFRNPIASIMGYSQTLNDDLEISVELREKFLEKIYNNGNKIEDLLSRLILWNKFESGETKLHKSNFDIFLLIEEISQSLSDKYKDRIISVYGESFLVDADRTLIELALKNLIENALKYSKDEVSISIKEGHISVDDKGIGIKSKDIDKVTKKFYRSGKHNWDNSMGLGLSIVKNILSLHKTKLEIESKVDEGSTFSFKL